MEKYNLSHHDCVFLVFDHNKYNKYLTGFAWFVAHIWAATVVGTGLELSCVCVCLPRAFEDESKARLGVVECAKHELLQPFNVMQEKDGEFDLEGDRLSVYELHPAKNGGFSLGDPKKLVCRVTLVYLCMWGQSLLLQRHKESYLTFFTMRMMIGILTQLCLFSLCLRRWVCGPVQVHCAAHGQRTSSNHKQPVRAGTLQVRAWGGRRRAEGKVAAWDGLFGLSLAVK